MVEYYPKNNTRPVIVAIIVGALLIVLNESSRYLLGFNIPRYIAMPLVFVIGTGILLRINPKGQKKINVKKKNL
jgi:hypothetical protein